MGVTGYFGGGWGGGTGVRGYLGGGWGGGDMGKQLGGGLECVKKVEVEKVVGGWKVERVK